MVSGWALSINALGAEFVQQPLGDLIGHLIFDPLLSPMNENSSGGAHFPSAMASR